MNKATEAANTFAERILEGIRGLALPEPQIVSNSSGGLKMEWSFTDLDIDLEVTSFGSVEEAGLLVDFHDRYSQEEAFCFPDWPSEEPDQIKLLAGLLACRRS